MAHGFTCAGMLPSQCTHMSKFSGLGSVGRSYIERVYQKLSYIEIVGRAAEQSVLRGVDEVQALPDYATKGEWVITDARHDSTGNAYHTQCLASQEVRRELLASAQFLGLITLLLRHGNLHVPKLFSLSVGVNITEVAHDMQAQVSKHVTGTLKLVNSYVTCHVLRMEGFVLVALYFELYQNIGTRNVAKELKKIAEGLVRDRDKKCLYGHGFFRIIQYETIVSSPSKTGPTGLHSPVFSQGRLQAQWKTSQHYQLYKDVGCSNQ